MKYSNVQATRCALHCQLWSLKKFERAKPFLLENAFVHMKEKVQFCVFMEIRLIRSCIVTEAETLRSSTKVGKHFRLLIKLFFAHMIHTDE